MATLSEVFARYEGKSGGGDKGSVHSYIDVYEREMTKVTDVDLLEVGVFAGESLAMWQEYLFGSRVVGLDVDLSRCSLPVDARLCDATDAVQLHATLGGATFDYIIDDGSHRLDHQIRTFDLLWSRVKVGGKYFVEDIQSDADLAALVHVVERAGLVPVTFDLRPVKGRYDDVLLMVCR